MEIPVQVSAEAFRDVGDIIQLIRDRLHQTRFEVFTPDPLADLLTVGYEVIKPQLSPEPFLLALPKQAVCTNIVRKILERDLRLRPDSPAYNERYRDLTKRLAQVELKPGEKRFSSGRDHLPDDADELHKSVINHFRQHWKTHLGGRIKAVRDFLRTDVASAKPFNPFAWNGHTFCLRAMRWLPHETGQTVTLDLRESDYYTYRTIANRSVRVRGQCGLTKKLSEDLLD
jgi:hypothetical protein